MAQNWKENLNTLLYGSKKNAYTFLRLLSVFVSISAFSLTLARYGFYLSQEEIESIRTGWNIALFLFIF
ncbi:MAG: hypothetical protein ACK4ND_17440, partial [Cytophagaceae bacterium]